MSARGGRPSKLTPELTVELYRLIGEEGLTQTGAAAAVGIHRATFQRWKAAGREARSGRFRDFCDALERAEAEFERTHLQRIGSGDPDVETRVRERNGEEIERITITRPPDWRRSAWLLERRWPERYGRRHVKVDTELKAEPQDRRPFEIIIVDPVRGRGPGEDQPPPKGIPP